MAVAFFLINAKREVKEIVDNVLFRNRLKSKAASMYGNIQQTIRQGYGLCSIHFNIEVGLCVDFIVIFREKGKLAK